MNFYIAITCLVISVAVLILAAVTGQEHLAITAATSCVGSGIATNRYAR